MKPIIFLPCILALCPPGANAELLPPPTLLESMAIDTVPSSFPVGFCLYTSAPDQYVAYYDEEHRMTVASRKLGSDVWSYYKLPSRVGWDSHNGITMEMDADGYLHLLGNMHVAALNYFKTSRPRDASAFVKMKQMTGLDEDRCTYPAFMRDGNDNLLFHYRSGASGRGNEIYNIYDLETASWRRLLDEPLTDGRGRMNAYFFGPVRGPDGYFHLCWVWRDTPDCVTNHDPSYAKSKDLVHWETAANEPIELPMTHGAGGLIVDPIPAGGGIINGACKVGFDSGGKVLISYHKFDEEGKTQAYIARLEHGEWVRHQVSEWDYRWDFSGNGSIVFEIHIGAVEPGTPGELKYPYRHKEEGSGVMILDEESLRLLRTERATPKYPAAMRRLISDVPGMRVIIRDDQGGVQPDGTRYAIRWETLPPNRDRRREGDLPQPAELTLHHFGFEENKSE